MSLASQAKKGESQWGMKASTFVPVIAEMRNYCGRQTVSSDYVNLTGHISSSMQNCK
jgi:hypothetical protein